MRRLMHLKFILEDEEKECAPWEEHRLPLPLQTIFRNRNYWSYNHSPRKQKQQSKRIMLYRPNELLQELRRQPLVGCANCCPYTHDSTTSTLRLRWLRTFVIDGRHIPSVDPSEFEKAFQSLVKHAVRTKQHVEARAVQRVEVYMVQHLHPTTKFPEHPPLLGKLLIPYMRSLPLLTVLDLRGCGERGQFHRNSNPTESAVVVAVAETHGGTLKRLYCARKCDVTQSTLDSFTQLEELDVTMCSNIRNVDFCSATLRVLYANWCYNLTDDGLRNATRLEVLHVEACESIASVAPFAHCLLELWCGGSCGIGSRALQRCRKLQVLDGWRNDAISLLEPFAGSLRELQIDGILNDAALATCTSLVKFSASGSHNVTTVASFDASLIELDASESGIDDAGLRTATNLVVLDADNTRIRSVQPFARSLLELSASCGISDASLRCATNIVCLDAAFSNTIRTVSPFSSSLRHVLAYGATTSLSYKGLRSATKLVTLECDRNRKITMIAPFADSVHRVTVENGANVAAQLPKFGFSRVVGDTFFWEDDSFVWSRDIALPCVQCVELLQKRVVEAEHSDRLRIENRTTISRKRKRLESY